MYSNQDRLFKAKALLEDCIDMAEDRADVLDGADGHPRPDSWMTLLGYLQAIDALLTNLKVAE